MKNQTYLNASDEKSRPLPSRFLGKLGLHSSLLAAVGLAVAGLLVSSGSAQAQILVDWTFETSQPASVGPFAPEVNNLGNGTTPAATINTPNAPTTATISSPAGNGSAHSFSSNGWDVGEYFQFTVSTIGVTGPLGIKYDQGSSGTGPSDFAVSYSTDGGTTFTVLANSAYKLANTNFSGGTVNAAFTHSFDFTNVADLGNLNSVVFRIVDQDTVSASGSTVGATGTDRIDNFIVQSVPEPTTVLGGALLVGVACWSQRRRLGAIVCA